MDNPLKFAAILEEELKEIEKSRELRLKNYKSPQTQEIENEKEAYQQAHSKNLIGIAFSGGGIRSATFNLGVLQALAELGLLKHFDYLSTVSGGGYIGSWLTAQIHRQTKLENTNQVKPKEELKNVAEEIERDISPSNNQRDTNNINRSAISWLRSYSNYLTPRLGVSADLGAFLATYVRNLILNLITIVSALSAVLLIPRIIAFFTKAIDEGQLNDIFLVISLVGFLVSLVFIIFNLYIMKASFSENSRKKWLNNFLTSSRGIVFLILIPILISSWSLCQSKWLFALKPFSYIDYPADKNTFGFPLVLVSLSLSGILFTGLFNKILRLRDEQREWLARLNGLISICNLIWLLFFVMALYSPIIIGFLGCWVQTGLGIGWIVSTLSGLLAGKSDKTSGTNTSKSFALEIVAKIAPYIFIIGLLAVLSLGIHSFLLRLSNLNEPFFIESICSVSSNLPAIRNTYLGQVWRTLNIEFLGLAFIAFSTIALLVSWAININEFSIHLPYRNRLVRAYLGASNKNRKSGAYTNKFTGFNKTDDIKLLDIIPSDSVGYPGPYHIVNATLNLVADTDLAWQQRKAASFVFTPKYSGYIINHGADSDKSPKEAYRKNADGYGGEVTLGTALAISGAAASPNMGFYSSPTLGFLMTVFNVRLGWWLGNPSQEKWQESCPTLGLFYLAFELLGRTNAKRNFVYLSDGGHFENLGIYELVRRRCRYIVASDAEADLDLNFNSLGEVIRKCYIDFGIEIEIDLDQIRRSKETGYSTKHCAVGRIHYEKVDEGQTSGFLVYLKSSLVGNEEEDILNYAKLNPDFPHQSTADQWFDEAQFESYRKLGYRVAKEPFENVVKELKHDSKENKSQSVNQESLFAELKNICKN
ncbi:MAG: patatin-like phospholipase family protein [Acidobacteria bacterium]|nr:patatin-like phospholipase family protein [Acidobacteriota bacterium]